MGGSRESGREWIAASTSAGGEGWREGGVLLPPSPSSHYHAPRGTGRPGGCPAEGGGEGGSAGVKESLPRRPPPHLWLWWGGARPWRSW